MKFSQRNIRIKEHEKKDAMKLIELMGMPIVQSYSEAEAQCAWLYAQKLVEGIISEDSDTLVFGGCLIRNFNKQS